MQHAHEHIHTDMQMLAPDVSMRSLSENGHRLNGHRLNGHRLQDHYQMQKYGCMMHGVDLCDEWPLIAYPDRLVDGAFEYELEAGMVLCVEALVSPEGGDFSIKLEDKVLITEDGFEKLTTYKIDRVLIGGAHHYNKKPTKKSATEVAPFYLNLTSELFACGADEAPYSWQK